MSDLTVKYRPKRWEEVVGQDAAIVTIVGALKECWGGRAWWVIGLAGTGCTTIARLIAEEKAKPDRVRFVTGQDVDTAMARRMAMENPGKEAVVANRAYVIDMPDTIPSQAMGLMLSALPCLHANICVVFTSTTADYKKFLAGDSCATELGSICKRVELATEGLEEHFAKRCKEIAEAEGLGGAPLSAYRDLARRTYTNMRGMLHQLGTAVVKRKET
jgi:hypothetical protein